MNPDTAGRQAPPGPQRREEAWREPAMGAQLQASGAGQQLPLPVWAARGSPAPGPGQTGPASAPSQPAPAYQGMTQVRPRAMVGSPNSLAGLRGAAISGRCRQVACTWLQHRLARCSGCTSAVRQAPPQVPSRGALQARSTFFSRQPGWPAHEPVAGASGRPAGHAVAGAQQGALPASSAPPQPASAPTAARPWLSQGASPAAQQPLMQPGLLFRAPGRSPAPTSARAPDPSTMVQLQRADLSARQPPFSPHQPGPAAGVAASTTVAAIRQQLAAQAAQAGTAPAGRPAVQWQQPALGQPVLVPLPGAADPVPLLQPAQTLLTLGPAHAQAPPVLPQLPAPAPPGPHVQPVPGQPGQPGQPAPRPATKAPPRHGSSVLPPPRKRLSGSAEAVRQAVGKEPRKPRPSHAAKYKEPKGGHAPFFAAPNLVCDACQHAAAWLHLFLVWQARRWAVAPCKASAAAGLMICMGQVPRS